MKTLPKSVLVSAVCAFSLIILDPEPTLNADKKIVRAVDESSPYGINTHHLPNGSGGVQAMDLAVDAGIKWIRIDMDWSLIEVAPGNFNWDAMNFIFNYAKNKGLGGSRKDIVN